MTEVINKKISYKGSANPAWRGGRILLGGYWRIWQPDHPFCNSHGYVREHRFIMEEYLGRYLRREEEIHHINGIKTDNRIENLMLFPNGAEHKRYERTLNMSDRICLLCNSSKTYIKKKTGRPDWLRYQDGYICRKCYRKI